MSCNTSLSDANNQGVDCLEKGDSLNAVHHFRNALSELVKSNLSRTPGHETKTQRRSTSGTTSRGNVIPLSSLDYSRRRKSVQQSEKANFSRHGFVLHSQGLRILLEDGSYSNDVMENSTIYSAIVIFNTALTFHLHGLKIDHLSAAHRRRFQLQKAKSLYQQSFQLLKSTTLEWYNCGATGNAAVDLLTMALLNNKALLHMEYEEQELSEAYASFQQLIGYALSVVQQSKERMDMNTDDEDVVRQQIEIYLLNACWFSYFIQASAAAAA